MAQHVSLVIAIDPAQLSPELLLPNVHHIKCKSEVAADNIRALLGSNKIDLIVADMNQHPDTTIQAIIPLLEFVKAGGLIIMTMKFYGIGRDRSAVQARITKTLASRIDVVNANAVWLMANTVNERTFIAKRSHDVAISECQAEPSQNAKECML